MSTDWLSLSAAASVLGVHPSTVRVWADQGRLPYLRTQGGHRRFRRQDLEIWQRTQQNNGSLQIDNLAQEALKRMRFEMSGAHLEDAVWYKKLDNEARDQYRISGRSLLMGLVSYLMSEGTEMDSEARSLGYEYASRGWGCGLSIVEAVDAFLFFRNLLVESILKFYENAGVRSSNSWADMVRKIGNFTDLILVTLLDTYEGYQKGQK